MMKIFLKKFFFVFFSKKLKVAQKLNMVPKFTGAHLTQGVHEKTYNRGKEFLCTIKEFLNSLIYHLFSLFKKMDYGMLTDVMTH